MDILSKQAAPFSFLVKYFVLLCDMQGSTLLFIQEPKQYHSFTQWWTAGLEMTEKCVILLASIDMDIHMIQEGEQRIWHDTFGVAVINPFTI